MLHSERMKQSDLKNPSGRISSEMRQEKSRRLLDSGGARGGSYFSFFYKKTGLNRSATSLCHAYHVGKYSIYPPRYSDTSRENGIEEVGKL
jgi:hypothetical protein